MKLATLALSASLLITTSVFAGREDVNEYFDSIQVHPTNGPFDRAKEPAENRKFREKALAHHDENRTIHVANLFPTETNGRALSVMLDAMLDIPPLEKRGCCSRIGIDGLRKLSQPC